MFSLAVFASENNLPSILAVQSRPYWLKHELAFGLGYWPLDHFNTYISGGAAYAYYFNDYIAWEVVNSQWHSNSSTGLENYLDKNFGAVPETFDILKNTLTSNFIYTPLYMKSIFAGSSVVWGDLSFVAGYGISQFDSMKNVRTVDLGAIMRFMMGSKWSTKVDLRSYNFLEGDLKPNLQIEIGLAYSFGGGPAEDAPKIDAQEDL